jgi:NADPH:quinone reductase-like Zn-dependent oxidoreductase
MLAAVATALNADDPLSGLQVGEHPEPTPPEGWAKVRVKAASLNHHDLWTLQGVGITEERLPMVLGCDAAGEDSDGNPVIVHSVIASDGWQGDETFDPKRSLLSERYAGAMAEWVCVPRRNLVPKPEALSWAEAACLPTAWLTAYRMLFTNSGTQPGGTVLVQGASGGVASALLVLGRAAGYRMWATARSESKRARALEIGADAVFEPGERLPTKVDAVMETVGEATWAHSVRSTRPGGTIVTCGATTGPNPPADLTRVYFLQLRVIGSTMGNRDELERLGRFCATTGVRPVIDAQIPLADARRAFERMAAGDLFGKLVLIP